MESVGEVRALEELEGSANVVKATPLPIERQFTTPRDGFVSLMGSLTASVIDTTMALVEDRSSLGSRKLDMGNVGRDSALGPVHVVKRILEQPGIP
ncbi:MAG: hypothetical protein O3A47_00530 [Chloroflexi bacterium]|nr:hypothetical protein [Chloroflexota bacterium]